MRLDMNLEERKYLDKVLRNYLTELNREIDHTDNSEFRHGLRHEAEVLYALKTKLDREREEEVMEGLGLS